MRLTIIPETATVGKDGLFFDGLVLATCDVPSDVHALQWYGSSGHIELKSTEPNQDIAQLPSWALSCLDVWELAYAAATAPLTIEEIKLNTAETAKQLLQSSDWTMLPDVQLKNKDEWVAYRAAVRAIAVNPDINTAVDPVFPPPPEERWV